MRPITQLLNICLGAPGAMLFLLACVLAWPQGHSHRTSKEAFIHPAFMSIAAPDVFSEPVELKSVKVLFQTTDNEKERDTKVSAYLQTPDWAVVAEKKNISGDFRTNSANGPYELELLAGNKIKKDDISGYNTTIEITVAVETEDTWKFDYIIELTFTDESKICNKFSSVTLNEKETDRKKSFRIQKTSSC
ncbi:MAG: hypothetical protein MOB07_03690 [Acidobacteria bacterium]|nr:hypothetical protein [Acidobacteriota bacterium]